MSARSMSWIYRSRVAYHAAIRVLYGGYAAARLAAVADLIPHDAHVLELCCGDCSLYLRHLEGRVASYVGLDVSPRFVQWARARGVDARVADVWSAALPDADVVVMQASLYQFIPDERAMLLRIRRTLPKGRPRRSRQTAPRPTRLRLRRPSRRAPMPRSRSLRLPQP